MKPIVLSDVLAVGEYPTPEHIDILAKAGFKSLINNQPDGEVDRFAGSAVLAAKAKAAGLAYAYAPLSSRTPTPEELAVYAAALKALPAPIYAFCYSGARSAAGCALLLAVTEEPAQILADFRAAGYEIDSLKPWLEDAHGGLPKPADRSAAPAATVVTPPPASALPPAHVVAAAKPEGIVVYPRARRYGGYAS